MATINNSNKSTYKALDENKIETPPIFSVQDPNINEITLNVNNTDQIDEMSNKTMTDFSTIDDRTIFDEIGDAIAKFFKDIGDAITKFFQDNGDAIAKFFKDAGDAIAKFFVDSYDVIIKFFQENYGIIIEIAIGIGILILICLFPTIFVGIIRAIGFGADGIIQGTRAAAYMAAQGGYVVAGGLCSVLQSVGAAGISGLGGLLKLLGALSLEGSAHFRTENM
ncbi:10794_t:CDS:2 [Entrophospora sp. SA101]|nr:8850_t:CDS:2 [Entrophospora sp. SA101]CAJ0645899.1 10794_t:CDS:2 [Entrophospora sp. SA101]CAJ0827750.1 5366_t:CDS:2 [Entrophospora sp. SA101]CAJ0846589.1 8326_t:CDS:2 [Entrophospora sp. SA101]CAJ0922125.1 12708_t:CDS:2 [Entrophospora sp. SA101]